MVLSVTHVLAPGAFGGLESVLLTLASGQARAGHDVTVVGTFTGPPEGQPFWDSMVAVEGVRAVPLILGSRQYLAERRAIEDIVRDVRTDVMHSHGYRSDLMAASLRGKLSIPTVSTVHGFSGHGLKNTLYEWLQRQAFRSFDGVVAVSRAIDVDLRSHGIPADVLTVLPNAWAPAETALPGSEARSRLGLPTEVPIIGWVGRMSPEKAPEVALQAFARLQMPDSRLVFVGDGPERGALEALSRDLGVVDRVHWAGIVPGAGRFLQAFDVLFLSSWTEGTPIVLLEAMAAEVPVVTTAVGGIPDVVSEREAVLVDAGDVEGMARALASSILEPEGAGRRAAAARARLEAEYDPVPWVDRYTRLYEAAMRRPRG